MAMYKQSMDYASDLRPDKWGEVCGQQLIVTCLQRYCVTGRPPKAIMFTGTLGTGKSTLARLTAMSMACSSRKDDDPDPCGRCDSCRAFSGAFFSLNTAVIPPQVTIAEFKDAIRWAKNTASASLWTDANRPVPLYMDDLDEHPKAHQQFLKRELDSKWCGFIVSATTNPDKVEPGLLDRFQVLYLQPPEMSDLVPWIRRIAQKVGIGPISEDAAATIARCADMNYRNILKLLQFVEVTGRDFSVEGVKRVALMAGLQG